MFKSMVRFVGISGAGWFVDFGLLWLLVARGVQPAAANFLSACTAAAIVYCVSRKIAFNAVGTRSARLGVVTYVAYTVFVVLCFSNLIQWISAELLDLSGRYNWELESPLAATIAKVVVTPANLAVNFIAARFISKRTG